MKSNELIPSIIAFPVMAILSPFLISTFQLRGGAAIATGWAFIVLQAFITTLFFRRGLTTAGFVGLVVVSFQLLIQAFGSFTVTRLLLGS